MLELIVKHCDYLQKCSLQIGSLYIALSNEIGM